MQKKWSEEIAEPPGPAAAVVDMPRALPAPPAATAPPEALSWVEIDRSALAHNVALFRRLAGRETRLMFVVKANAYGHGLVEVSDILAALGADWLATFSLDEALTLRERGLQVPILVLGPTPPSLLRTAALARVSVTIASPEAMEDLARERPGPIAVHLKIETGTNRQGLGEADLPGIAKLARSRALRREVTVEGAYTHFANVEDTTDNTFAMEQLERFRARVDRLEALGVRPPLLHTACTAASLLYPETYHGMLRVGIGVYGLWPSETTLVGVRQGRRLDLQLRPVMSWKTRICQVKRLEIGETVGYGRTHEVMRPTRVAILPVGYSNGYSRSLTGRAYVLVEGRRAPILGRVMMNMTIVDVTDIPEARPGAEVVLLGRSGSQRLTAERLAGWMDTIHYEVVANVERNGRRIVVGEP